MEIHRRLSGTLGKEALWKSKMVNGSIVPTKWMEVLKAKEKVIRYSNPKGQEHIVKIGTCPQTIRTE